jgi:ABC-type antimicrobial peptide transport system permease subunit
VVGVVGNVQHAELGGEPSLDLYVPFRQTSSANLFIIVKNELPQREFQRRVEEALWAIDPEQSLFDFQTYEQRILASVWQLRLSRLLLTLFGCVAMALSAIGIYGVMSYRAEQRTREIGIRLALGATPGGVRALIVKRGLWLGSLGLAVGLCGAVLQGRLLAAAIRGMPSMDAVSMAVAVSTLLIITVAACGLPAWRASHTDPAVSLRDA